MNKGDHNMTWEERQQLEALKKANVPVAKIARQLGFCRQTIYNELERGAYVHTCDYWDEVRYSADKGQQVHNENQSNKGPGLKIGTDRAYADFLEAKMLGVQKDGTVDKRKRYSPAAALAAASAEGFQTSVSTTTLYRYIDQRIFLHLTNKDLWEKGKRKKRKYNKVRRIAHPALPSITNRPEQIGQRSEPGHWEMDLVVSCSRGKGALLTLAERSTREEMIFKLPDKQAVTVRAVFDKLERRMDRKRFRERFRSITTDNGPEFLEYDQLTQSVFGGRRFDIWYCHSYAAWEKGTNENHNRMIRRWFPKGTDFSKVTNAEIAALQDWMNGYPRKVLGWKTPLAAAL